MPFVCLRDIRNVASKALPSLTADHRNILIDLAASHQLNQSLTMKQLVLLHGGSATTVRRRLRQLIEGGYVVKLPNHRDGRSDHFALTKQARLQMSKVRSCMLRINAEMLTREREADSAPGKHLRSS